MCIKTQNRVQNYSVIVPHNYLNMYGYNGSVIVSQKMYNIIVELFVKDLQRCSIKVYPW